MAGGCTQNYLYIIICALGLLRIVVGDPRQISVLSTTMEWLLVILAFLVLYWGQGPFFIKKGGDDDCQKRLYTTKIYMVSGDLGERLCRAIKIPRLKLSRSFLMVITGY